MISSRILYGLDLSPLSGAPFSIDIICSAYQRFGECSVLVQSFLNQTFDNWSLHVLHDGPSKDFDQLASIYSDKRLKFSSTKKRFSDYGHSLREIGLQQSKGDYVLITNADNYYVPHFLSLVGKAIASCSPDVILFDMIHSHECPGNRLQESYNLFQTSFAINSVDMGSVVVKGDLARRAGFQSKTYAADWDYFESVANLVQGREMRMVKIPKVLLVHN